MTSAFPAREPFDNSQESLEQQGLQYPMALIQPYDKLEKIDGHDPAQYFLKLGNRHYNSFLSRSAGQDLEMAINCYRKALETDPGLAEGYVKLASALYDKGEMSVETAMQYCHTALSMNPEHPEPHLFLGYFLKQAGRLDAALAEFQKAIAKAPMQSAKPRMAYGRTILQKAAGEPNPINRLQWTLEGMTQLIVGLTLIPADAATFDTLKGALVSDLQIYSILGLAKSVSMLGLKTVSVSIIRWGAEKLPNEPIFFHQLGDIHTQRREADAAVYHYIRAQELDPGNSLVQKKLGNAYLLCNDSSSAARSLEKVIEQDATDFDTMYQLAQIYTEQGDYIRALYYFKELTTRYEKNPYVHSNMAYVLFKLEDYDGAIKEYRLAVSYGEDKVWTATVAQTLGTIYHQLKHDPQAAMEMFQLACKLDPHNLDAISILAELYVDLGHYEVAIGAYQYILNFEPDNSDCYNYIGYLLWQLDKNDEAISAYHKAIALNPDCAIAYNNLGVIYLDENHNPRQALEVFQLALDIKPDYTLACFNVGRAQEELGLITEAAKSYSNALSLNAENPELEQQEILERLDSLFKVS